MSREYTNEERKAAEARVKKEQDRVKNTKARMNEISNKRKRIMNALIGASQKMSNIESAAFSSLLHRERQLREEQSDRGAAKRKEVASRAATNNKLNMIHNAITTDPKYMKITNAKRTLAALETSKLAVEDAAYNEAHMAHMNAEQKLQTMKNELALMKKSEGGKRRTHRKRNHKRKCTRRR